MRAINHAMSILSWQENLTEEELPPSWMWHLDDVLEEWFEDVKVARREKYGQGGSEVEAQMEKNEWARGRR